MKLKFKRFLQRLGGRSVVVGAPGPELTAGEMRAAFSVPEKHPLWRGINQLLDDSLSAALTDAVDGEQHGEANAVERGQAKALMEFKARLMEFKAAAGEDSDD